MGCTDDAENVLCSQEDADCDYISSCNDEAEDSRVIVHASDAARKGSQKIVIRTVVTNIFVLVVAYVERLGLQELWIEYGTGKMCRYLPAHDIVHVLGISKATLLPAFHAFTGSDMVSFARICIKSDELFGEYMRKMIKYSRICPRSINAVSKETCSVGEICHSPN